MLARASPAREAKCDTGPPVQPTTYVNAGRLEEARQTAARFLEAFPGMMVTTAIEATPGDPVFYPIKLKACGTGACRSDHRHRTSCLGGEEGNNPAQ